MGRWPFYAAFFFCLLLLVGGITQAAHGLEELQGEPVLATLRSLPALHWGEAREQGRAGLAKAGQWGTGVWRMGVRCLRQRVTPFVYKVWERLSYVVATVYLKLIKQVRILFRGGGCTAR